MFIYGNKDVLYISFNKVVPKLYNRKYIKK